MDMVLEVGIDFWDIVEMYLVNLIVVEYIGWFEEFFGDWFEKIGCCNEVVLVIKYLGVGFKIWCDGVLILL